MKKFLSLLLTAALLCSITVSFASCGSTEKVPVKLVDIPLTEEEYAFVVKKGNTDLQTSFNAYLDEIKNNGEFQTILDKYFKGEGEKNGVVVTTGSVANTAENLIVVTNCPFEPFEYIGDDGKAYGVDIEIAIGYAAANNLTVVLKNIDFDSIFDEVDAGYADIGMAGITVDEARQKLYDFTSTYYNASQKLVVLASNTDFDACTTAADVEDVLKSLTGKKVGYQLGTTGGMYINGDEDWGFDGFANLVGKGYDTALTAINDMINGNLYAVVVDEAPGAAMVKGVNGNN